MARAKARRIVMNESAKCLSGRDVERVVSRFSSGRGGETPREFGGDEVEAAERGGDVVMPARPPSSLEVVEAEFALEIFVDALKICRLKPGDGNS